MSTGTRHKRVALGPWSITVKLRADQAYAIQRSAAYRTLVRPTLTALERFGARFTGPPRADELPAGVADTPITREIWARVAAVPEWYHSIDLGHGIVTPGKFDHRPVVDRYGLPERLDGRRALDIASWDGFWAFELERRGARDVVALDLERWTELDLPPPVKDWMIRTGADGSVGAGFEVARRVLRSRVRPRKLSVYRLTPERVGGTFDFVFCGDLLLHLMSPPRALQRIRSVTAGEAVFVDVFDPRLDEITEYPITRYLGGMWLCTWWMPSLRCLTQMVKDAGYSSVEVLDTFQVAERGCEALWRAAIRARP